MIFHFYPCTILFMNFEIWKKDKKRWNIKLKMWEFVSAIRNKFSRFVTRKHISCLVGNKLLSTRITSETTSTLQKGENFERLVATMRKLRVKIL